MITPTVAGVPTILTQTQLNEIMSGPHSIVTRAEIRSELAGDNTWEPIPVVDGEVVLSEQRQPCRLRLVTVAEQIFGRNDAGEPTVVQPAPEITPWGSWIRVWQEVATPSLRTPLHYPLGVFRVETVTIAKDQVEVEGLDALSVLDSDDVPLGLQRILPHTSRMSRIEQLIEQAWPPMTDAWVRLHDLRGLGTGAVAATQPAQFDVTRDTLIQAVMAPLGKCLYADRGLGKAIYLVHNLIDPGDDPKPVVEITAGTPHAAGLVSLSVRKSRESVLNRVVVCWTDSTKTVVRQQQTQVDLVGAADSDSPIHQGGRFGVQSEFLSATDVKTVADAEARGRRRISQRLWEATRISVVSTPVHGLEIGDCVALRDQTGNIGAGWVATASIPLGSGGGAWRLTIQPANLIDTPLGRRSTKTGTVAVSTEFRKWKTLNSDAIDETCKTTKGWVAVGCAISATSKTEMTLVCSHTTGLIHTSGQYITTSNPPKMRATITLGKLGASHLDENMEFRVEIGNQHGPWVQVRKGRSASISSGELTIPAGTGAQMITLRYKGANAPTQKVHVTELRVEIPASR